MSIEVREVAYHEAGHAGIAIQLGFKVEEIRICRSESEGRWYGQNKRPPGSYLLATKFDMVNKTRTFEFDGLKKELSIDCGGFLAQAKHHALQHCRSARFSTQNDITWIVAWMKDVRPETQANLELRFTSDKDGEDFVVFVHPRWFGGVDRGVFLRGVTELMPLGSDADGEIGKIVKSVMNALDSPQLWDKVCRIADGLIANCINSGSIDTEEINRILNS